MPRSPMTVNTNRASSLDLMGQLSVDKGTWVPAIVHFLAMFQIYPFAETSQHDEAPSSPDYTRPSLYVCIRQFPKASWAVKPRGYWSHYHCVQPWVEIEVDWAKFLSLHHPSCWCQARILWVAGHIILWDDRRVWESSRSVVLSSSFFKLPITKSRMQNTSRPSIR